MTRDQALPYVSWIVDNALSARKCKVTDILPTDTLVGYQCGFEPLFVAVRCYMGMIINDSDAEEIAQDYLLERKWFSNNTPKDADYILVGKNNEN